MNPVGSMSLQQLLASPAFISSDMQQQAHLARNPTQVNYISRLREYQAQAHPEQLLTGMLPLLQHMQGLASFRQHTMPMVYGRPVNSTAAMAFALSQAQQNPTAFTGSSDFWTGARG
jgi:hypothetical protein